MLELSSNTIKVLGIFGRLSPEQELLFDSLEEKYSTAKPTSDFGYDVFRHLTLTFIPNASVTDVRTQLELLQQLNKFLPLRIKVKRAFVKDEETLPGAQHIALEFELAETEELTKFIRLSVGDHTVVTWYTKVVWFVSKENQTAVMQELSTFKTMEFSDFYLVSNKQNDKNTIFTTNLFEYNDRNLKNKSSKMTSVQLSGTFN